VSNVWKYDILHYLGSQYHTFVEFDKQSVLMFGDLYEWNKTTTTTRK